MLNYSKFKKMAFKFDPELMHDFSFEFFHYFPRIMKSLFPGADFLGREGRYQLESHNLKWPFPIGAAAGLDKNGHALKYLSLLGFGAVEVGTVTPLQQKGNEKPRIFRYPSEEALRNSMGFPNCGEDKILCNVQKFHRDEFFPKASIGVNIGGNKQNVGNQKFFDDIVKLYKTFSGVSEYLVINISSPNTEGLRSWQKGEDLKNLLLSLSDARKESPIPLFIKIAPDLEDQDVRDIVHLAKEFLLSGIVATNTTIDPNRGKGGVSGRPLFQKSKHIRGLILDSIRETPQIDLIGVGGFFDFHEILDFWSQGGKFVQIYTSFIYKGPDVLKEIQMGIEDILQKLGAVSIQEALSDGGKNLKKFL